jgi:long-chain acyl-CoA synthetase
MKEALAIRTERSVSNLAHLDLDNLERFGVYRRLHFEDRSYTNMEEFGRAGSLARLLDEYGVKPGDRVLVMMPNSPELTAAFPAIWTIGATIVPVIPQWTAGEVAAIFRNSGATVVLTVPALASRLAQAAATAGDVKHLLVFGEAEPPGSVNITPLLTNLAPIQTPVDRSAGDLAILLYTSGTTGTPKGVMLTHGNFLAALDGVLRQNPQLGPGPMLHPLPLTHVYGVLMQFLANRWGVSSVLVPQFEPKRVFEAIERYQVQYMPVVPTMLVYLLNHPGRERYNLSSLTRITSGGAALPEQLRLDFERAFQCRIQQGYGLSESASVAASYELEQTYRPGSAGQAVPGVEIRILDDQDRPLPSPRIGEICLAGPNISTGYFRDPDATRQALRDGWLHTGDVGYVDEEGYLFITDRKKDLIIKGGENVSPREIEEALYLHPAVAEAAVVGVPHAVYGEDIWAVVQLKRDATAGEEDIRLHVAKYVTKFKVPSRVVFTDALPLNSNGKILKRAVRVQLEAGSLSCCNAKILKSS